MRQARSVTVIVVAALGALASCQNQAVGPHDMGINAGGLGGAVNPGGGGSGGADAAGGERVGDGGIGNIGVGGGGGSVGGQDRSGFGGFALGFGGFRGGPGGNGGANVGCVTGAAARPAIPAPATVSFLEQVAYSTGAGAYSVVVGDLNGDYLPDLLVGDYNVGARSMVNFARVGFSPLIDHSQATGLKSLVMGDLNGDGRVDLAGMTPDGVSVLLGQGDTFGPPTTYAAGPDPKAVALADLNGDGWVDMAVANRPQTGLFGIDTGGGISVLLNTGSGTFFETTYPTTLHPSSIAAADLNGDCRPDLVIGDDDPTWGGAGGLGVFLNRGDGSFPSGTTYAAGTRPASVAIGDLNGDGKPDLAATGGETNSNVYVLLNYGRGVFTAPVSYSVRDPSNPLAYTGSAAAAQVVIGDLNGDQVGDLAVASPCCGLAILVNRGNGTLAAPVNYPVLNYAVSVGFGDFNGDGLGDLAVVSQNLGQLPVSSSLGIHYNVTR